MNLVSLLNVIGIVDWRDVLEIIFFSACVYRISRWLKRDTHHHLMAYSFAYIGLLIASSLLQLTAINHALIIALPMVGALAILFHQDLLQRNFIMYKNRINTKKIAAHEWPEALLRSCLISLNEGKELFIIVEHQHQLDPLLASEHIIDAPISPALLDLILHSSNTQAHKLLWIKSTGILHAANTTWHLPDHQDQQAAAVKELPLWKQDALLMTLKTDALVFKVLPESRSCDVVVAGKIFEQLSATQTLKLIKKHLNIATTSAQGESFHETPSHKTHSEQRAS